MTDVTYHTTTIDWTVAAIWAVLLLACGAFWGTVAWLVAEHLL